MEKFICESINKNMVVGSYEKRDNTVRLHFLEFIPQKGEMFAAKDMGVYVPLDTLKSIVNKVEHTEPMANAKPQTILEAKVAKEENNPVKSRKTKISI